MRGIGWDFETMLLNVELDRRSLRCLYHTNDSNPCVELRSFVYSYVDCVEHSHI